MSEHIEECGEGEELIVRKDVLFVNSNENFHKVALKEDVATALGSSNISQN